jgi:chemotaxis protein MotB
MAEKASIVIKKVKKGGHGGAHGGAWKVAYADFVTAMMCFFLVMWLMGADEETKSSVSHYFNHPNTPYKDGKDPKSTSTHPLGESEGNGDAVLNGGNGFWPEDLIEKPRPLNDALKAHKTLSLMIEDLLDGQVYGMDVDPEHVKFSLPDGVLFKAGSAELLPGAAKELDLLGNVLKTFKGYITIEGHTDNIDSRGTKYSTNWELSLARSLAVMNYFIKKHGFREKILYPVGMGSRRAIASNDTPDGRKKNRRVEFILNYTRPF